MAGLGALPAAFDLVLALALLWLGWRTLASPDLIRAVVLFVAFGLLMSLAWVRLRAPDVALAEAAIGAGLTGALLLAALAGLAATVGRDRPRRHLGAWLPGLTLLLVAVGLGHTLAALPAPGAALPALVEAKLGASGVSNPVTAVLLNFRGYDTLLEVMVLLVALLGAWSLDSPPPAPGPLGGPVLDTLARFLVPILILVAAYLLWAGAHAPGGAFQAGSVLGAAGVLLLLAGFRLQYVFAGLRLRLSVLVGPLVFLGVAAFTIGLGGRMLELPPQWASSLILAVETAATFSIGVTLSALFFGAEPRANGGAGGQRP